MEQCATKKYKIKSNLDLKFDEMSCLTLYHLVVRLSSVHQDINFKMLFDQFDHIYAYNYIASDHYLHRNAPTIMVNHITFVVSNRLPEGTKYCQSNLFLCVTI